MNSWVTIQCSAYKHALHNIGISITITLCLLCIFSSWPGFIFVSMELSSISSGLSSLIGLLCMHPNCILYSYSLDHTFCTVIHKFRAMHIFQHDYSWVNVVSTLVWVWTRLMAQSSSSFFDDIGCIQMSMWRIYDTRRSYIRWVIPGMSELRLRWVSYYCLDNFITYHKTHPLLHSKTTLPRYRSFSSLTLSARTSLLNLFKLKLLNKKEYKELLVVMENSFSNSS